MTGIATTGSAASNARFWASLLFGGLMVGVAASLSYKLTLGSDLGLMAEITWPRLLMLLGAGAALGLGGAVDRALDDRPEREVTIFAVSLGAALVAGPLAVAGGLPMLVLGALGGGVAGAALAWTLTRNHRLLALPLGLAFVASGYGMLYAAGWGRGDLAPNRALILWLLGDASNARLPWAVLMSAASLALTLSAVHVARALPAWPGTGAQRRQLASLSLVARGVSIGAVGPVAFVGLFAPRLARLLGGERTPGKSLVLSAVAGGVCLVMLDSVARAMAGGFAYPLNMQALMVFGPAFLWLWAARLRERNAPPAGRWAGVLVGAVVVLIGLATLAALAFVWSLKAAFS